MRVIGDDRLRAAELLTVLVDAQLAQGEIDEATATCAELNGRVSGLDISPLRARAAAAHARVLAAAGDVGQAIAHCWRRPSTNSTPGNCRGCGRRC